MAEIKRLMTFPDAFAVVGTRRECQLQLGNAVPPRLAGAVASALRDELRGFATKVPGDVSAVAA